MAEYDVSVIVPTHNPRPAYISRVLEALRKQTLPVGQWELIVVDNLSDAPLSNNLELGWHPAARCIRENTLGLTPTRLRGIAESTGSTLVFVDDDNVLEPSYLATTVEISRNACMGAWGGSVEPEFEVPPPQWTRAYWGLLAIRRVEEDQWSEEIDNWRALPNGAGMCVRREVALEYAAKCATDRIRASLDRRGKSLLGGGDTDMAYTACDMGLLMGIFRDLRLTHLIPAERLRTIYLMRLMRSIAYSGTMLRLARGKLAPTLPSSLGGKIKRMVRAAFRDRHPLMSWAELLGSEKALKDYARRSSLLGGEQLAGNPVWAKSCNQDRAQRAA